MSTVNQLRVRMELDRLFRVVNELYPSFDKPIPTLSFDLRGRVAGRAHYADNLIEINNYLLDTNTEDMISDTLPHELAHLVAGKVYGYRISPHGAEWRRVARSLGCSGDRCHTYKTKPARQTRKFLYVCPCENQFRIGLNVHRKMQRGQVRICRTCRSSISFVREVLE